MEFVMTVNMDNAAFDDDEEIGRCLSRVKTVVLQTVGAGADQHGAILDSNGNRVGSWEIRA